MESWDIASLDVAPHHPQVLRSDDETRAIAIHLPGGEELQEHQVHERTYLLVASGEVEIGHDGTMVNGGPGFLAHFGPNERHAVRAITDARIVLVLAPWPGVGHPSRFGEDDGQRAEMIIGLHAVLFTDDAAATRSFLRDTLGLDSVDAGGGWLIFAVPAAELAAHPAEGRPHHEVHLMCDDIRATVAELEAKGAEFVGGVVEQRWGLSTKLTLPGGGELPIYEPRHPSPLIS